MVYVNCHTEGPKTCFLFFLSIRQIVTRIGHRIYVIYPKSRNFCMLYELTLELKYWLQNLSWKDKLCDIYWMYFRPTINFTYQLLLKVLHTNSNQQAATTTQ